MGKMPIKKNVTVCGSCKNTCSPASFMMFCVKVTTSRSVAHICGWEKKPNLPKYASNRSSKS